MSPYGRFNNFVVDLFIKLRNGNSVFAFAECARAEAFNIFMRAQMRLNRLAKHARTLTVYNGHCAYSRKHRVINILIKLQYCLVSRHSAQINLADTVRCPRETIPETRRVFLRDASSQRLPLKRSPSKETHILTAPADT